ncbi:ATP-binding protein [Streptomyces sp. NPDC060334]|uniref:ATP-binding protein n=1 Tax=unclassified Streptomyces TaxID=2593676 RepID=UPI000AA6B55B|nr:ATP-binding protein [Streptomyces sp. WM4235]
MATLRAEEARQIARHALAHQAEAVVDDVLMVVSELVSNAVRHAGGVTGFDIRVEADAVVVEVADASPRQPHSPGSPVHVPGGFGWLLVNRLTKHTDIRSGPHGKTITAYLAT